MIERRREETANDPKLSDTRQETVAPACEPDPRVRWSEWLGVIVEFGKTIIAGLSSSRFRRGTPNNSLIAKQLIARRNQTAQEQKEFRQKVWSLWLGEGIRRLENEPEEATIEQGKAHSESDRETQNKRKSDEERHDALIRQLGDASRILKRSYTLEELWEAQVRCDPRIAWLLAPTAHSLFSDSFDGDITGGSK